MRNLSNTSLAIALTLLLSASFAQAFMFGLAGSPIGGPFGGQGATGVDGGCALYAHDIVGREILVTKTRSLNGEGFPIDDIGFPSVAEDGTIFFAIGTFERGNISWRMFSARPGPGSSAPVASAIPLPAVNQLPDMRVDPRPTPDGNGGLVFLAPDGDGHDTVFRLSAKQLRGVVRTGSQTRSGSRVRLIKFGSVDPAADNVAFTGSLDHGGSAQMLAFDSGVTVLATEEGQAPGGGTFLKSGFGLPALAAESGKLPMVAFTARTTTGDALFIYRDGRLRRVLGSSSPCANGQFDYLSTAKPALLADGTVAVLGACSGRSLLLSLSPAGAPRLILRSGDGFAGQFTGIDAPVFTNSGTIVFEADEQDNEPKIFSLSNAGVMSQIVPSPASESVISSSSPPGRHTILAIALAANRFGRVAYLGSR